MFAHFAHYFVSTSLSITNLHSQSLHYHGRINMSFSDDSYRIIPNKCLII